MVGAGGRVAAFLIILILVLFVASQIISDPLQAFLFSVVSYFVGFTTYAVWKLNVSKAAADMSAIFLFLPLIVIVATVPLSSPSQTITATTNWLVTYIQGLPVSILGDIGGSIAAVVLGMGN